MSIKITGLQQAQEALRKELAKLQGGKFVLVGIHESAGMVEGEDFSMATLGAVQQFGNDQIPSRPWLDVGVQSGSKEYLDIISEGVESGLNQDQILNQIGVTAVGYAQQYMTDLQNPPNAPSTVKKKGSSNPLIDTGAMRASVTYTIAGQTPQEGLE